MKALAALLLWALPAGASQPMQTGSADPVIHARSEWRCHERKAPCDDAFIDSDLAGIPADPLKTRIVVHHTADDARDYRVDPKAKGDDGIKKILGEMRAIHAARGLDTIGYHYVIDWKGGIWETRPLGLIGSHSHYHNDHSVGVALFGDFTDKQPSKEQLAKLKELMLWLTKTQAIAPEEIHGHHYDKATECPGKLLAGVTTPGVEPAKPSLLSVIKKEIAAYYRQGVLESSVAKAISQALSNAGF